MNLNPLDAIVSLGTAAIQSIWPDKTKQAEEQRKLIELYQKGDIAELTAHVTLLQGQMAINAKEAEHKSIFVAGWRPFVGWVCGSSLLYAGVLKPFIEMIATLFGFTEEFPVVDLAMMMPILLGMLGISHHRSEDKKNGTQTNRVGK